MTSRDQERSEEIMRTDLVATHETVHSHGSQPRTSSIHEAEGASPDELLFTFFALELLILSMSKAAH